MAVAVARPILDNPPALTPRRLRDFPYQVEGFPFFWLRDESGLTVEKASGAPPEPAASPLRVQ